MSDHIKLGRDGEDFAEKFLIKTGYTILHRNWQFSHKEIDIIAEIKEFLVIIEVKTRSSNYYGNPHDMVSKKKMRFLIEAAQAYMDKFDIDKEVRFDVLSIIRQNDAFAVEHIDNAFNPII